MSQRKSGAQRIIGNAYKIVKPLFQVRSYLYAQCKRCCSVVCCLRNDYKVVTAALYVFENEDPSQSLKMLAQKLDINDKYEINNLIFPHQHIKEDYADKHISIYFVHDFLLPLRFYEKKAFSLQQALELLHGALSSLNHLHLHDIVHGNISLSTSYLTKHSNDHNCKFALSILDTRYFTEEDTEEIEEKLFQSEGQSLGLEPTFKDDLESIVYVIAHLLAKGKLLTVQRFQLEWTTEAEFLRWKSCDFFKELLTFIPPELEILMEIYTVAKSLRRNEKPDYSKLMKKVLEKIAALSKKSSPTTTPQQNTLQEEDITVTVDKASEKEGRARKHF